MVANALMLTIAIVLGLGFWFMQRDVYKRQPYCATPNFNNNSFN